MLCTCMSCIIIIGLSIGLGVYVASSESSAEVPPLEVIVKSNPPSVSPSIAPSIAPTMPPFVWCYESNESVALGNDRYASIRSALVSSGTSRYDQFSDDESYQRRSLCWLAFGDRLELDATDPFLEQRYVLATIYYGLNQPTILFVDGWLSGKPECEWQPMVECDSRSDTTVTRLNLHGNDLAGDLPEEMAALQHVAYLDMSSNLLHGDISLVIGGWTHLEELKLSSNNFVSIPENLESWKALKRLDISSNEIEGTIPESLALSTELVYLDISTNEFFGTIPSVLGNLTYLQSFYTHGNLLEGSMPKEVCFLREEKELMHLSTDCKVPGPEVDCDCCTICNDYDVDMNPWD
ncbi:hypothetical protein ACHAXR_007066 [Thalassiosira sp. AJA248-18]